MSIVSFTELRKHAADHQYGLAVVNSHSLPAAMGVIESAAKLDAPVVLTVRSSELKDGLLPSLETMARHARIPVALLVKQIQNTAQAIQAIRLGCNCMVLANGLNQSVNSEIRSSAMSCGIPVLEKGELCGPLHEIDEELASATLQAVAKMPSSWQAFNKLISQESARFMHDYFNKTGASGQGQFAIKTCNPWHPVEHLIIYNTTRDDATSAELAAEGRRVLDKIPGVRATWSGRSVNPDASYRWCWLVRFAHPAVIDSYRENPDHVAYADNHFRPIAGDRISIDYELTGPEEN
jgi:hypothetical protein